MDATVSTTHPIGVGKQKINPMSIHLTNLWVWGQSSSSDNLQIRVIRVSQYEPSSSCRHQTLNP